MSNNPLEPTVLSYSSQVVPPGWARWLMRPIGWPFFAVMSVTALWILWRFRIPSPALPANTFIPFIGFIIALGVVWFLRLVLALVLCGIYRTPWKGFRTRLWRSGIPPVVALSLVVSIRYHVLEVLAWELSESAMHHRAESVIAAERAKMPPPLGPVLVYREVWVGLYKCDRVLYYPDVGVGVVVFGVQGSLKDGFAYCPGGTPPTPRMPFGMRTMRYTPLGGAWYRVEFYLGPIT